MIRFALTVAIVVGVCYGIEVKTYKALKNAVLGAKRTRTTEVILKMM